MWDENFVMESAIKNRFPGYAVRKISRSLRTFQGFMSTRICIEISFELSLLLAHLTLESQSLHKHAKRKIILAKRKNALLQHCNASQPAFQPNDDISTGFENNLKTEVITSN